jgi:hypothetical protein
VVLVGLSFLLAVAGVISWPLQLVIDVVLAGFVVHLRAQAKRAGELHALRGARATRPGPVARGAGQAGARPAWQAGVQPGARPAREDQPAGGHQPGYEPTYVASAYEPAAYEPAAYEPTAYAEWSEPLPGAWGPDAAEAAGAEWEPSVAADAATGTDGARETWDPVPVPPPTYTMKPSAPPRARPAIPDLDETMPEIDVTELEVLLQRRRAVND